MTLKKILTISVIALAPLSYGVIHHYQDNHNFKIHITQNVKSQNSSSIHQISDDGQNFEGDDSNSQKEKSDNFLEDSQDNYFEIKTIDVAQKYKAPVKLEPLITKYAEKYNVPIGLAHAIIHTESRFNIDAHGKAGEIGLMQLMPTTARSLGFKGSLKNLYNPVVNLDYGMRYLSKANKLGKGDLCHTILKYNAGYGAKSMNPVSQRYCQSVKKYLASV